jgi:hypothetical protein
VDSINQLEEEDILHQVDSENVKNLNDKDMD